MSEKKLVSAEKLNYDKPFEFIRVYLEESVSVHIVVQARSMIKWEDIINIEDYPEILESMIDWKELKGEKKCYLTHDNGSAIVLIDYDELAKYWKYFLENVIVSRYKVNHDERIHKLNLKKDGRTSKN